MKVLFVVPGDQSHASTRYRVINLLPYLREEGIHCDVVSLTESRENIFGPDIFGTLWFTLKVLVIGAWYDVVYFQKIIFPKIYMSMVIAVVDHIIYDFDDARYTTPYWVEDEKSRTEAFHTMLQSASVVIAGSPVLSEYAGKYAKQVYCLPPSLQRELYESKREERKLSDDQVTIGWIGNPQNLRYLATIEKPLEIILNEYDEVQLIVITSGDKPIMPLEHRKGKDVEYYEWSLEKELDYLSEADIIVRPLINDEWTRGKGGFVSVLQPMALGIPVVVTPIGMLEDIVSHDESGFYATTESEWVTYLSKLIEEPDKRLSMGEQAFRTIDEGFWAEERAKELIEVLEIV